jgi:hypothetical protein
MPRLRLSLHTGAGKHLHGGRTAFYGGYADESADGFRRLIIKKENDMATPYKECPHCGAHLDSGEKCDCRAAGNPVALENVVDLDRQTRENNKAMNRVLDFIAPEK